MFIFVQFVFNLYLLLLILQQNVIHLIYKRFCSNNGLFNLIQDEHISFYVNNPLICDVIRYFVDKLYISFVCAFSLRYVILTADTLSYYYSNPSDARSIQGKHASTSAEAAPLSAFVRPQGLPSAKPTPRNTLNSRNSGSKSDFKFGGIALPFATPSEGTLRSSPVFPAHTPTPSPTPELTSTPASSRGNLASASGSMSQSYAGHHLAPASDSSCQSIRVENLPHFPAPVGGLSSASGSISRVTPRKGSLSRNGSLSRQGSLSRHSVTHGLINSHNRNDSNSVNVLTHEAEGASLVHLTQRHKRSSSNASSAKSGHHAADDMSMPPQPFHMRTRSAQGRQATAFESSTSRVDDDAAEMGEDTLLDSLSLRDLRRVSANTYPHCELKLKFRRNNRLLLTLWDTEELAEWFRKFSQILEVRHRICWRSDETVHPQ